jgi:geranylgeranyl diphosphate synthase type I
MDSFSPTFPELRGAVDDELAAYLAGARARLPEGALLVDEIDRLISAGGKRLRPAFCFWGYRAAGGDKEIEIVRASASLELLHTFAIVHDDIMDRSDERRGEPTVHVRHGEDVALLVGDLALVLADDLFMRSGFDPAVLASAFRFYSDMRQEVIAGQYLDLRAAGQIDVSESHARRIAAMKSGGYSVEKPLAIGAALAAASPSFLQDLHEFGAPLGEAFQLSDDLLGVFGDRASTGKPVDSDIREGKRNYLYARAVRTLDGDDLDFFRTKWGGGDELEETAVERLRTLVDASGARSAAESLMSELRDRALAALSRLPTGEAARAALDALARDAVERTS